MALSNMLLQYIVLIYLYVYFFSLDGEILKVPLVSSLVLAHSSQLIDICELIWIWVLKFSINKVW